MARSSANSESAESRQIAGIPPPLMARKDRLVQLLIDFVMNLLLRTWTGHPTRGTHSARTSQHHSESDDRLAVFGGMRSRTSATSAVSVRLQRFVRPQSNNPTRSTAATLAASRTGNRYAHRSRQRRSDSGSHKCGRGTDILMPRRIASPGADPRALGCAGTHGRVSEWPPRKRGQARTRQEAARPSSFHVRSRYSW